MTTQMTGFLATECPACDGNGQVVTGNGHQRRWWDCDDCRTTGWVIHEEVPAIAVDYLNSVMLEMHRDTTGWEDEHSFSEAEGWNDALRSVTDDISANFEEAR